MAEPSDMSPDASQSTDGLDRRATRTDALLKRYEKEIDLYKFYLDVSVKGSLFAFGITGAIVSYFFTNAEGNTLLIWSLALPLILNGGFAFLFYNWGFAIFQVNLN